MDNEHISDPPKETDSGTIPEIGIQIACFLVGIVLAYVLSGDLRRHGAELLAQFTSGSWEVTTDRQSVEKVIRATYGNRPSEWAVHFAAGTGQGFPLDSKYRANTIQDVGQKALSEEAHLRFASAPLPQSYGSFLADSVLNLALRTRGRDAISLRALATVLGQGPKWSRQKLNDKSYRRAQEILASLPQTHPLREAIDNFVGFEKPIGIGNEFPAFEVGTDPVYDRDGAWSSSAQTLPQEGRCRGTVAPINGSESPVTGNVSVSPRVVEVHLVRPWLSDALLDSEARLNSNVSAQYFGEDGALRLIPARLWVLMEDDVKFELSSGSDESRAKAWNGATNCCRVTCDGVSLSLLPDTIRSTKENVFSGLVGGRSPILFAIVSRRRIK